MQSLSNQAVIQEHQEIFAQIYQAAKDDNWDRLTEINNQGKLFIDLRQLEFPFLTPAGKLAQEKNWPAFHLLLKAGANRNFVARDLVYLGFAETAVKWFKAGWISANYIAEAYAMLGNFQESWLWHEKNFASILSLARGFALAQNFSQALKLHEQFSVPQALIVENLVLGAGLETAVALCPWVEKPEMLASVITGLALRGEAVDAAYLCVTDVSLLIKFSQILVQIGALQQALSFVQSRSGLQVGLLAPGFARVGNFKCCIDWIAQHQVSAQTLAQEFAQVGNITAIKTLYRNHRFGVNRVVEICGQANLHQQLLAVREIQRNFDNYAGLAQPFLAAGLFANFVALIISHHIDVRNLDQVIIKSQYFTQVDKAIRLLINISDPALREKILNLVLERKALNSGEIGAEISPALLDKAAHLRNLVTLGIVANFDLALTFGQNVALRAWYRTSKTNLERKFRRDVFFNVAEFIADLPRPKLESLYYSAQKFVTQKQGLAPAAVSAEPGTRAEIFKGGKI